MALLSRQCCSKLFTLPTTTTSTTLVFLRPSLFHPATAAASLVCTRGLKKKHLFKKKKKRKMKINDGKEYTVDHLYWENYFKLNPQILEERRARNIALAV